MSSTEALAGFTTVQIPTSRPQRRKVAPFTWHNPVWSDYLADPFVLRTDGGYYAYGTASQGSDGRHFPVLYSPDLVNWEYCGGALTPLDSLPAGSQYWAPEVAERDGVYYLYYSAAPPGDDSQHRLRVAISRDPAGPFVDSGRLLLPDEGFTIDGHPFYDRRTDRWFLFYARDFLDGERVGTGLAVVPLENDLITVAGTPTTVLRATADWQIYERNRDHYGNRWSAWHTLEGPFVVEHDGRYYCFYSGGNWQNPGYGIGYAVADDPLGPWHESAAPVLVANTLADKRDDVGATVSSARVLTTCEDVGIYGPGHNSVVLAPDGATEMLVYHAWDADGTARRMHLDPLIWTADGPRCDGPAIGERSVTLRSV